MYQPPSPPGGQPGQWGGQPTPYPYPPQSGPYAPLYPPSYQAPYKKKRTGLIIGLIIGVIVTLFACIGGGFGLFSLLLSALDNSPAKPIAQHYYDAIKVQDYATAYSYIDPTIVSQDTTQPTTLDQLTFTSLAQAADARDGKVISYTVTVTGINTSTSTGNTANVDVNVKRENKSYTTHLQLKQEGADWKIIRLDGI